MNARKTGKADAAARKGVDGKQLGDEKVVKQNWTEEKNPYLGGESRKKTDYERIVAYNFRTVRQNMGKTQWEMTKILGVKEQSTIANLEAGRRCPKLNTIARYCEKLNQDLATFITVPLENHHEIKSADEEFIEEKRKVIRQRRQSARQSKQSPGSN